MLGLIIRISYRLAVAVIVLMLPAAAFAQNFSAREYPYLYKSPRAMGMGGAYIAIGGRVDSLFYNPAALINIPKDKGWEVNLLNLNATASQNSIDFSKDLQDALDTGDLNNDGSSDDDQTKAVNNVIAKYQGKNLHLAVTDFTSIGKSDDTFAFGVGGLASGMLNAVPHQGFGSTGLLEVNANMTYGGIGGVSFGVTEGLFVGLTAKSLHRESVTHIFTAQEIVDHQDDIGDYLKDQVRETGNALGFDAGVLWKFARDSWWRPSVGLSVMNIGDLDFKAAGVLPQTINAGLAVNPKISTFRSLILGIDYVDITENYTQDKDMAKRIRYGGELQLFDITPVEIAIRAGMYQNSPTFGLDLRLLTFLLSYTRYTEEVGAYAGQDKDTRHLVTFNFGW